MHYSLISNAIFSSVFLSSPNLELVTTPVKENGEYSLEDIRLFKTLYFDGLTKQSFFDSLVGIFHCLGLIVAKFDILGRTGPLQDDSSV